MGGLFVYGEKRFLETQGETLTVIELREKLAKIDQDKNKKVITLYNNMLKFKLCNYVIY